MRRTAAGLVALALVLAGCTPDAGADPADDPLLVAAAADLRPAFTELGARFEQATGRPVTFTFGSSGQLAQQLVEGAPADLYASADAAYVTQVLDAGVGDPAYRATYAHGRLAIWSRSDTWGGWDDLVAVAADDDVTNVAIANPDHAPYGRAAEEALHAAGVLAELRPRLVYGENVADTQRLAATGNADVAVVALSLAIAADEADGPAEGRWVLVDDGLHAPLRQDLVVVADEPDRAALARAFAELVVSDEGDEVMRRFGFVLPDDRDG